mmetsp:Transcript_7730/g.18942  ORF Transcript_7730/g.18942 Transcript_7730/m.18942 type:complete len:203 (+) Transcript_7730:2090-2698(+)
MHQHNPKRRTLISREASIATTAATHRARLLYKRQTVRQGWLLGIKEGFYRANSRFTGIIIEIDGSFVSRNGLHVMDWEVKGLVPPSWQEGCGITIESTKSRVIYLRMVFHVIDIGLGFSDRSLLQGDVWIELHSLESEPRGSNIFEQFAKVLSKFVRPLHVLFCISLRIRLKGRSVKLRPVAESSMDKRRSVNIFAKGIFDL